MEYECRGRVELHEVHVIDVAPWESLVWVNHKGIGPVEGFKTLKMTRWDIDQV